MDLTGIFATMYFPRLPGLANLGIGARVEYAPDEVGIEIPMRVALSDPDEKIVFEATLPVPGLLTQRPGVRPAGNVSMSVAKLPISIPGTYTLRAETQESRMEATWEVALLADRRA